MSITSDIRVASHQERLNHNLVRQSPEMRLLVNVCCDTRRRQPLARPAVNRIKDLRGIKLLPPVIDSVEDLPENHLICILHDRCGNRYVSEPTSDILNVNGKIYAVRIVSQPRQRAPQIE